MTLSRSRMAKRGQELLTATRRRGIKGRVVHRSMEVRAECLFDFMRRDQWGYYSLNLKGLVTVCAPCLTPFVMA